MSFLMDAESKEVISATLNAELGERLEFLSVMEQYQQRSDRTPTADSRWMQTLVKQLTGK
jgi:hypothetical protein